MHKHIAGIALVPVLMRFVVQAAEIQCQDDVKSQHYTAEEQQLVDQFWGEALVYLGENGIESMIYDCY